MPPSSRPGAASPALPELVIPDCCNIGIMFRALFAVNAAVLAAILVQGGGLQRFLDAAVLIEPACLASLLSLCALRTVIGHVAMPAVSTAPMVGRWLQRALCVLVPVAMTAALIRFLISGLVFPGGFTMLSVEQGAWLAAGFGLALQHYFELRARAFSPALSEARLQALQARIRPHFLFNSLNAVISLIRSEPRRAETTLEDLAELFRVLMRDARDMTSLEEEIRLCRQYLSIEKVRLGERLQVQWTTSNISDKMLQKARFPSLLLQPILENAVHYGVEPMPEPQPVEIELTRNGDRIEIVVTNALPEPGHGGMEEGKAGNHMALQNIRERLALLYDVEAQLSVQRRDGKFVVQLQLPYVRGAI
jgi:two-component system, LytTR family, sensor histidine kinase AlgZ